MATLILNKSIRSKGFFSEYLKNIEKFIQDQGLNENYKKDLDEFKNSINRNGHLIENFLNEDQASLSLLALGKIQSGKTSHLIGTIAYAGDIGIDLTVVFTGLTKPLNNQTIERIGKDLKFKNLELFDIPSSLRNKDIKEKIEQIKNNYSETTKKYFVFTVLKSKSRLQNLEIILKEIKKVTNNFRVVFIDDEADLGSQNSKARKKSEAILYKKIYESIKIPSKNILISYTATPQAILLTESFGKLRPEFCFTIDPKVGYTGLTEILSNEYKNNIYIIDDWHSNVFAQNTSPISLDYALIEFFFTILFRKFYPNIFYSELKNSEFLQNQMKSVQMLIHQSNKQDDHRDLFKIVKNRLSELLENISNLEINEVNLNSLNNSNWGLVYQKIRKRLTNPILNNQIDEKIVEFMKKIKIPEIRIVNSDPKLEKDKRNMPNKDSDWEQNDSWIFIGGDILGRGLTIPQLTVTYFLRNSLKPNLDTVLQQMRFCGYRKAYLKMTSIYMTENHKKSFEYMELVNRVIWNKAKEWEKNNYNLKKNISSIVYAQPNNVNFEPTRKSVQDPNLIDKKLSDTTFQARKIYPLRYLVNNSNLLKSWLFETNISLQPCTNQWYVSENVDPSLLHKLLSNWTLDPSEKSIFLGILELFNRNFESLGFSDTPITLFVKQPEVTTKLSKIEHIENLKNKIISFRTLKNSKKLDWHVWTQSGIYNQDMLKIYQTFSITAVGESQRGLRSLLEYDSTLVIIEPIKFMPEIRSRKDIIGLGVTLNILSPKGYQTRIMGYR